MDIHFGLIWVRYDNLKESSDKHQSKRERIAGIPSWSWVYFPVKVRWYDIKRSSMLRACQILEYGHADPNPKSRAESLKYYKLSVQKNF